MKRWAFFVYSAVAYACFVCTLLYAIGFIGNFRFGWFVPKSMDVGGEGAGLAEALLVDVLLLGVFALQHSGMARRGFKEKWTKLVPRPIERSTYVLFSSAALALLFWLWRPIGGQVWAFTDRGATMALVIASLAGWGVALIATLHIDHLELLGLRQTFDGLAKRQRAPSRFVTPGLYRVVRHPLYTGFLIAFWATPVMTVGHLVFAIAMTGYVLVAVQLEERDLVREFGDTYERYRRAVPMLAPIPRRADAARSRRGDVVRGAKLGS